MTKEEVRQAVLDIISDITPDEDLSGIKDNVSLKEQIDLDSMDFLDIVMELRKRYGIEVPEAEYPKLATMESTVTYLEPKLKDKKNGK
ncbi:MAG: acyl carrier protein [bacterium]